MGNLTNEDSYAAARENTRQRYRSIGRIWCPVLGEYIAFTKVGFLHLLRKRGKRRALSEQMRRFSLLNHIKTIIEDPATAVVHRKGETENLVKRHGKKSFTSFPAEFWALTKECNGSVVTVVVRQTRTKKKHFFSIYG